jgi:hypothetical protein
MFHVKIYSLRKKVGAFRKIDACLAGLPRLELIMVALVFIFALPDIDSLPGSGSGKCCVWQEFFG